MEEKSQMFMYFCKYNIEFQKLNSKFNILANWRTYKMFGIIPEVTIKSLKLESVWQRSKFMVRHTAYFTNWLLLQVNTFFIFHVRFVEIRFLGFSGFAVWHWSSHKDNFLYLTTTNYQILFFYFFAWWNIFSVNDIVLVSLWLAWHISNIDLVFPLLTWNK